MGPVDGHRRAAVVGREERLATARFGDDRPLGDRPGLLIGCCHDTIGHRSRPVAEAIQRYGRRSRTCQPPATSTSVRHCPHRDARGGSHDAGAPAVARARSSCQHDRRASSNDVKESMIWLK